MVADIREIFFLLEDKVTKKHEQKSSHAQRPNDNPNDWSWFRPARHNRFSLTPAAARVHEDLCLCKQETKQSNANPSIHDMLRQDMIVQG